MNAAIASSQRAGLPIRIAEATVSGVGDRSAADQRRGAFGLEAVEERRAAALLKPFHQAVTLPALPTGIASASGAPPSSSMTSKAAVF